MALLGCDVIMTELIPVTESSAQKIVAKTPALPDAQTVTAVRHYTDRLFAFRVTLVNFLANSSYL